MNKTTTKSIAQALQDECQIPHSSTGMVSMRKFPYPYSAAIAICSDIDDTNTTEEFLEIQRFLNSKNSTSMGEGIGLEIGNSFYFSDKELPEYINESDCYDIKKYYIFWGKIENYLLEIMNKEF